MEELNRCTLFICRYRREFIGLYLAEFMWRRRVKISGRDAFQAILEDIASFYDSEAWRDRSDLGVLTQATTERKQRIALRQGIDLVGIHFKISSLDEVHMNAISAFFKHLLPIENGA